LVIIVQQEIKDKWKEHQKKLFYEEIPSEYCCFKDKIVTDPNILTTEVETAIKNMKRGKAAGPDNVEAEFLKLIIERIKWIVDIFNNIYDTGDIPNEWLKSESIALPKKIGATKYEKYSTISLILL